MAPEGGVGSGAGDFKAAAAMTCLWSGGSGGRLAFWDRMLEELPGRRGDRIGSFELRLLGDAGGDMCFSTPAVAMVPECRWFLDMSNRSIWSAETMVWVPSSAVGIFSRLIGDTRPSFNPRSFCTVLEAIGPSGTRPSLLLTGTASDEASSVVDLFPDNMKPCCLFELSCACVPGTKAGKGTTPVRWAVVGREGTEGSVSWETIAETDNEAGGSLRAVEGLLGLGRNVGRVGDSGCMS
jgi:hypothetical protein